MPKNKKRQRDPGMHSVAKGNQWFHCFAEGFACGAMRCPAEVDAASGLGHSVVSTAAHGHELNTAAEWLHGEEKVVYGDSGHLGIERREVFTDSACQFKIAMRHGQRRAPPDTPQGWLEDRCETAKAHRRAKVEHPFRVIKRHFGFQKTRYRGIKKIDHKLKMLFSLASLYKIRQRRPATA